MTVEIKNLGSVKLSLKKLSDEIVDKKILNKIGNFLMTSIKERTLKGYDVSGDAFEEYTPRYALFRHKKGLPTNLVDLFFTGSMMSSMTYSVDEDSVRIFFQPTKDKKGVSNPAKAYWLNQNREFFSLNPDELSDAVTLYEDYIEEIL